MYNNPSATYAVEYSHTDMHSPNSGSEHNLRFFATKAFAMKYMATLISESSEDFDVPGVITHDTYCNSDDNYQTFISLHSVHANQTIPLYV